MSASSRNAMLAVDATRRGVGSSQIELRPLTGADELTLTNHDAAAAVALLAWLAPTHTITTMSVSEIDRGLAQLYQALYGPRAECRSACASCGVQFEFTLDLADIIAVQDAERPGPPDADGAWTMPDGRRVRAPRLDDLADGTHDLVGRLIVDGDAAADSEVVGAFLERSAPIMTLDFDTTCPRCDAGSSVRFDLAVYLMRRLVGERPFLLRETHMLASRYGWSRDDILALPRDDRRSFAQLIEGETVQHRWSS